MEHTNTPALPLPSSGATDNTVAGSSNHQPAPLPDISSDQHPAAPAGDAHAAGVPARTAAAPGSGQAQAMAQARLINTDGLRTEAQISEIATARRNNMSGHFAQVRQSLLNFFSSSGARARAFIGEKQSQITAASSTALRSVQAVVTSGIQGAEARGHQVLETIGEFVEGAVTSVRGTVQGVNQQAVGIVNSIRIPDLLGGSQIRAFILNLLQRATALVNGALDQVLEFLHRAIDVAGDLMLSFLNTFRGLINQGLSLVVSAFQRILQQVLQALNRVVDLIVSMLQRAWQSAAVPFLARLETSLTQALSKGEQQTIRQLRANRTLYLNALNSAMGSRQAGSPVQGAPPTAKSMDGALQQLGAESIENNRRVVQEFAQDTAGTLASIVEKVAGIVGQIIHGITARIAQAVQVVASGVARVMD
ncbi:MAG TPA: hypothetical protein VHW72_09405, partial [Candidatus Angelobacter sp.]|nr:hypothetical protein [Candidatus Angelobacter sp.]